MKLYELINFNPVNSNQNRRSYFNKIKSIKNRSDSDSDSGSFADVYSVGSNKRLNQVTKVGQGGKLSDTGNITDAKDISGDAYLSYIKAIHDSNSNNPYFPRIHNLKIFKNEQDNINYRINMEKLINFNTEKIIYNHELMVSLYNYMFNEKLKISQGIIDRNFFAEEIRAEIEKAIQNRAIHNIKDPNLKEAVEFIIKIGETGGFTADIHSGNIMWRITGTRPQLVIIDPLA